MPTYVPTTTQQQEEMLSSIGAASMDELLAAIPESVRLRRLLDLPPALSEPALKKYLTKLAAKNTNLEQMVSFLGAGSYERYVPSVVRHLALRSEFYTSYTPYQPEVSQGMLQAIFEFQTMVCQISGMDTANASLYDGSTAAVEAALLAYNYTGRDEILVARSVDPQYRQTLATYAWTRGFILREIPAPSGVVDLKDLKNYLSDTTAAVIIQQPNFFGNLEDMQSLEQAIHANKSLFVSVVTEPASLGVIAPPGEYNADIFASEGMSFGAPPSYGGPSVGLFAVKNELLKRMPGRLTGETVDDRGQRGFVLTLQTREQHIRRERATSNICTNQALIALFATIYLAAIGKQGFAELGAQCVQRAHYAFDRITALPGFQPIFDQPFFDEFVVSCPKPPAQILAKARQHGVAAGYDLSRTYLEYPNALLITVTEARTRDDIDALVAELSEVAQ